MHISLILLKLVHYEVNFLLDFRMTVNGEVDDEDVFRNIDAAESQGGGSASETSVGTRYVNVVKQHQVIILF